MKLKTIILAISLLFSFSSFAEESEEHSGDVAVGPELDIQNSGIVLEGRWIPVVDVHLHTGSWQGMTPRFQDRLAGRVPNGFKWTMEPLIDYMLSSKAIVKQLNSAGIYAGGVFALYSPHTTGFASNDFTAAKVAEHSDRLYGFASLKVDQWNTMSEENLKAFEEAFAKHPEHVGIKLAHAHLQMRLDDKRFEPIYEISSRLGKPMYLHTGTSPNPGTRYEPPYADPAYLEWAIKKYPKAIFILGHTGYDTKYRKLTFTDSAIKLAKEYDNVYIEPGALGATRGAHLVDDFVTRIKKAGVIDKVIYGSDGVQFPGYVRKHLQNYVNAMLRNGYTTDEIATVLYENFEKVFNVKMPTAPVEE